MEYFEIDDIFYNLNVVIAESSGERKESIFTYRISFYFKKTFSRCTEPCRRKDHFSQSAFEPQSIFMPLHLPFLSQITCVHTSTTFTNQVKPISWIFRKLFQSPVTSWPTYVKPLIDRVLQHPVYFPLFAIFNALCSLFGLKNCCKIMN